MRVLVHPIPTMQSIFGSQTVPILDALAVIGTGIALLFIVELEKCPSARIGLRFGGRRRPTMISGAQSNT